MQISGVVQEIKSFNWTNPRAKPNENPVVPLYSIVLQGHDDWYGCGSKVPQVAPGQNVSFFVEVKGDRKNVLLPTLEVSGAAAPVAPTPVQTSTVTNIKPKAVKEDWNARTQYWNDKEKNDKFMEPEYRFRTAHGQALSFLTLLQGAGALPITKAQEASPAKKYDAMLALLETVAEQFVAEFENSKGSDEEVPPGSVATTEEVAEFPDVATS